MSTWETLHYHSPALKNQGQGGPHPRIAVANCTALMSHREAGLQQVHANYTSATLEASELQTHKLPHARGDEAPRVKLRLCWSLFVSSL